MKAGGHLCRVADNTVWSHWQVASRSSEVNFTKNYTLFYLYVKWSAAVYILSMNKSRRCECDYYSLCVVWDFGVVSFHVNEMRVCQLQVNKCGAFVETTSVNFTGDGFHVQETYVTPLVAASTQPCFARQTNKRTDGERYCVKPHLDHGQGHRIKPPPCGES